MALSIPCAWLLLLPSNLTDFARSVLAVSTFWSNILFWTETGYFDTAGTLKPLLHTWSLAVEEQFYILFPLILLMAWRFGRRGLILTLACIFVICLAAAQWTAYHSPAAAFYLLPTRGWELVLGALIAIYLQDSGGVSGKAWLSLAGLGLILFSVFVFSDKTPSPSLSTLVPDCGTALIILFTSPQTAAYRLLTHKWLWRRPH